MTYWREVLSNDALRAHRAWVFRGRTGDGRLILKDEQLGEARTSGTYFQFALIENCNFDGAHIVYARFDDGEIRRCVFTKGSLYNSRFLDATVEATRFDQSDLRSCWYADARITECQFDESDMRGATFIRAVVTRCSFNNTNLQATQLDHGVFQACAFRMARLADTAVGTQFIDCDFGGANLEGLRLKDTRFTRCKLAGVIGKPKIEGAFEIVDADFSSDGALVDGAPRSAEELRRYWEHGG